MTDATSSTSAAPRAESGSADSTDRRRLSGEFGVIWTLWLTYGAFYFCRTNISAGVAGMKSPVSEGGLGIPTDEIGLILGSLKIAYGLGQLLNGQLSERIPPRVMLAIGMFGSAALNVLFGFSSGFYFLLFVWATNGFCQSLGWTPCMRVVANWVPVARRGKAIGIVGTGYQITLGLTYVISGKAAEYLGWRAAFYVPAGLLAATGIFMLFALRDAPDDESSDNLRAEARPARAPQLSASEGLYWTLYNPTLWLLGLSLGLLNACRYGFLDWGVLHLMDTQQVRVGKAVLQFFVIAIGATAGSYLAGWATDRFFGSRRAPVACLLMAGLGFLSLGYDFIVRHSVLGTMVLLVVVGFCIYGPQVLLVGTAPADLAHRGTSAAAAGFVNFMGYLGAASGDVITGYYSAPEHGGWQVAIYVWAGWAFAGAVIMRVMWNTTADSSRLLPHAVPKLMAIVAAMGACAAVWFSQPTSTLPIATAIAAACLGGTFASRWLAVPALAMTTPALLVVLGSFFQNRSELAWSQFLSIVAYGLVTIAAVMILVERSGDEGCERS